MKYYSKINGLRFIAIFLVLLEHFAPFIGRPIFAGFYGVDLFFVISGFLVTLVLLKTKEQKFRKNYFHFIGRRTLRIFPIYYLTILILWIINAPYIHYFLTSLLTYSFNYSIASTHLQMPMSPFWSLCVEEQFYLFWPFIVLSLKNKPRILLLITGIIIIIGYTQQVYSFIPSLTEYNYFSILTRMASLGLGALGAILLKEDLLPGKLLENKRVEYIALVLFPFVLAAIPYRFSMPVFGIFSLYFVLKCTTDGFSLNFINTFLTNKKVMNLGIISYGIYVFHMPINYYFTKYLFDPVWLNINYSSLGKFSKLEWHSWIIKFPLYSFLSIAVATLSFNYIETPILKLKERFFKY
jgi:peptidoglycan/LPS O-acetylase OafA/YrhL